jgi:polyhydroxyalkanoate synthesis regulator phasin
MGFMDKVKQAAQDVASEAKKATGQAQEKLEGAQVKKKMNDAAQQLGWLTYRERTKGTAAGADADRLIAEISALEQQLASEAGEASTQAGPSGTGQTPPDSTP